MKKILVLTLALCACLCSCTAAKNSEDTGGDSQVMQNSSVNQIALDAAEQKAEYYRALAEELEEKVLSVRTELFACRVEYEARIDQLESRLSSLLAGVGGNGADTPPETNHGSSNGGQTNNGDTETEREPQQSIQPSEPTEDPYAGMQFQITDGKATLIAYIGNAQRVEIPATYQGCSVVAIADRAFENKTRLQGVSVPDGVKTIGWFAFSGCVALKDVTLPESITSVSYGAFLNCNSALVIRCPKGSYAERYAQSYGIETK